MDTSPALTILPSKIDTNAIPRWIIEEYLGMEKDIAEWYTSFFFWRAWDGKEDTLTDIYTKARANAEAKWKALQQTGVVKGASDRSIYLQLYDAHQTKWFQYIEETEDVREMIEKMLKEEIERDPDSGTRYELEFVLKTMIPTMEKLGVPKEQIFSIPTNLSKVKAAVPVVRQLLKAEDQEAAEKSIMEVFADAADPNLSFREFRTKSNERIGKTKKETPPPVPGGVYLVPGGEIVVIESDRPHTTAIQVALKGVVADLTIKDGASLLKMLSQRILPKTNAFERMVLNREDGLLIQGTDGVPLPTPEDMAQLAFQETAKVKYYLDALLFAQGVATVKVFSITDYTGDDLRRWVMQKFQFEVQFDPLDIITLAIKKYYEAIHPDLFSLFPDCNISMIAKEDQWGLYVAVLLIRP